MDEFDQEPKRPAMVLTGFIAPCLLLTAVAFAYQAQLFAGAGWRGGEYAYAFIAVASGAILAGAALKLARPRSPWSSFGTGLILAGTLGVALTIAIIALFAIVMSQSDWTF